MMMEGSANQVIRDYHYLIGNPTPLPFWSFGYHQSRWGYKDIEHVRDVYRKFKEFSIPLDVMWMDKDYMDRSRSFTIDTTNFYGI